MSQTIEVHVPAEPDVAAIASPERIAAHDAASAAAGAEGAAMDAVSAVEEIAGDLEETDDELEELRECLTRFQTETKTELSAMAQALATMAGAVQALASQHERSLEESQRRETQTETSSANGSLLTPEHPETKEASTSKEAPAETKAEVPLIDETAAQKAKYQPRL